MKPNKKDANTEQIYREIGKERLVFTAFVTGTEPNSPIWI